MDELASRTRLIEDWAKLARLGVSHLSLVQCNELCWLVGYRIGIDGIKTETAAQLLLEELPNFFQRSGVLTLEAFKTHGKSLKPKTEEWNLACVAAFGVVLGYLDKEFVRRIAELRGSLSRFNEICEETVGLEQIQGLAGLLEPRHWVSTRQVRRKYIPGKDNKWSPLWGVTVVESLESYLRQHGLRLTESCERLAATKIAETVDVVEMSTPLLTEDSSVLDAVKHVRTAMNTAVDTVVDKKFEDFLGRYAPPVLWFWKLPGRLTVRYGKLWSNLAWLLFMILASYGAHWLVVLLGIVSMDTPVHQLALFLASIDPYNWFS